MPIRSREDFQDLTERVTAFFDADPDGRAHELRRLFVELMDFHPDRGSVSLRTTGNLQLPDSVERIAELDDVRVYYLPLQTKRVTQRDASAAARQIADLLGEDMLLVCTNHEDRGEHAGDASQLHLIHPLFHPKLTLRRMVIERGIPQRTAVQQVSNIYWEMRDRGSIGSALRHAFDVEPVTKEFFGVYERLHERALGLISGVSGEEANQFVQTLFNRLMFIYFLSRKGWLRYEGDTDYLNALWDAYASDTRQSNFYDDRLHRLFFLGLNNPDQRDVRGGVDFLIGDVPFLNGGLFEETELDRRDGVIVPDAAVRPLLTELFDKFNFTVMESTPLDIEVAVDPEMLGKVFEELVTGRHSKGAYYTPRPVVSFMCREALKGYLEGALTPTLSQREREQSAIARFVDERSTEGIDVPMAGRIARALAEVTVVDPACGSGAYLLGMMHELVELQELLFNVTRDAKSLYELKLEIIQRNLYGVDLDEFAVNIAMLRLWLSLAIDYDGERPEPLPNLDFKILQGDSLLGPDPSQADQNAYLLAQSDLPALKARYLRETDAHAKLRLREQIAEGQAALSEAMGDTVAESALDWRVEFAEVFATGGFDIAIANPPYVQLQNDGGRLGKLYAPCGFQTLVKRGDIYQLFYERGCQLLKASDGLLAYITSNSWLRAQYGKTTRRYFAEQHRPRRWLDLGKDVFESAIVDSGVLLLQTGAPVPVSHRDPLGFPAVDMDTLPGVDFPPPDDQWGEVRPDGDGPWSVLSEIEWSVMEKMQRVGTPLKDWDVKINYGIKTGLNDAFIIDTPTRDRLVREDPKSAEIIKPILRGKDIQRYRAQWADRWLIDTHTGYGDTPPVNVNHYSAIKRHLDRFLPKIKNRQDQGVTYYNLRACAYYEDFAKEKLFWIELVDQPRFAYDDSEMFCVNSAYTLVGKSVKFLCGALNSKLIHWFVRTAALESGMGTPRWIRSTMDRIPVADVDAEDEAPIVQIVDQLLNDPDADTESQESNLDHLVYSLYSLSEAEIEAVERRLGAEGSDAKG